MLDDTDAQALISMPKIFVDDDPVHLSPGVNEARALESADRTEAFTLDYYRASIKLSKARYQNRTRTTIILVRLDIDGPPHTNPDGKVIGGTHLHIYRDGYEAKWAQEIDPAVFSNPTDLVLTFQEFCNLCNIGNLPTIEVPLFS